MTFRKSYLIFGAAIPILLSMASCTLSAAVAADNELPGLFVNAGEDIKLEKVTRRKWTYPIIADLDQDGFNDILLNDHGFSIKVYWNNKGKYGAGIDVLMGDTHGITVGDYNEDGDLDVLVSRGGGSGSNARNAIIYTVTKDREFIRQADFEEPLAKMRGRSAKFVDGDNDGDLDLLIFGVPLDFDNPDGANYIYENDGKGVLKLHSLLPKTLKEGQKFTLTDFNGDAIPDIILYGSGQMIAYQGEGDLTYKDVSAKVFGGVTDYITSIAEIDYDNDGDYDLYVTRSLELEGGETFFDPATNVLAFHAKRGKFNFGDVEIGDTLRLDNFQGGWPHKRIFTGEPALDYKFKGDKHPGRDIEIVNSDALGWPDAMPNKGLYLGYVGNQKWRFAADTFSSLTAVIHGVKSYPAHNRRDEPLDILFENNDGIFTDVTAAAGLLHEAHNNGAIVADFDNNGFSDLAVIRQGNPSKPNQQLVYLNQGGIFKAVDNHAITSDELGAMGMGGVTFDYNRDGKPDLIYGNEWGNWHMYRGESKNGAGFVSLDIGDAPSGKASALGASVILSACNTTQTKKIGSSAAPLSQSFDKVLSFGIGDCEGAIEARAKWSNGEVATIINLPLNTHSYLGKR